MTLKFVYIKNNAKEKENFTGNNDWMIRLSSDNSTGMVETKQIPTTIFFDSMNDECRICKTRYKSNLSLLTKVIKSLRKINDYQGYYTAYLTENLTDEEFEKISFEFIQTFDENIQPMKLASDIKRLFMLTKINFTQGELEHVFNCSEDQIGEIISKIASVDRKKDFHIDSI
ncbi:hypothetical protein KAJ27_21120 [bacterium]|nr:hypothetical protein [bacterium]